MSAAAAGGTPIGVDPAAPVLVQVVRGEIVEAQHRGDVVAVGEGEWCAPHSVRRID